MKWSTTAQWLPLTGAEHWQRGKAGATGPARPAGAKSAASILRALRAAGLDKLHRGNDVRLRGRTLLRDAAALKDKVAKDVARRPDVLALAQQFPFTAPYHPVVSAFLS